MNQAEDFIDLIGVNIGGSDRQVQARAPPAWVEFEQLVEHLLTARFAA